MPPRTGSSAYLLTRVNLHSGGEEVDQVAIAATITPLVEHVQNGKMHRDFELTGTGIWMAAPLDPHHVSIVYLIRRIPYWGKALPGGDLSADAPQGPEHAPTIPDPRREALRRGAHPNTRH